MTNTDYKIEQIVPELAWNIRHQMLYPHLPLSVSQLDDDFSGTHLGIFSNNKLIGAVSLFEGEDNLMFRRLAIVKEYLNKNLEAIFVEYIIDYAKKAGKKYIWCNSRMSNINFYKQYGFYTTGNSYSKHGFDFLTMRKDLK